MNNKMELDKLGVRNLSGTVASILKVLLKECPSNFWSIVVRLLLFSLRIPLIEWGENVW